MNIKGVLLSVEHVYNVYISGLILCPKNDKVKRSCSHYRIYKTLEKNEVGSIGSTRA